MQNSIRFVSCEHKVFIINLVTVVETMRSLCRHSWFSYFKTIALACNECGVLTQLNTLVVEIFQIHINVYISMSNEIYYT